MLTTRRSVTGSSDQLAEHGIAASENRVQRLCQQQQIWSVFAKKRGLSRRAGPPVHDDLVDRDFTAPAANVTWLTDITEHPTSEGKLYLCAIKDVWSTRIVGYSMSHRMTAALAVSALSNAVALRDPDGTKVHSDRLSLVNISACVTPNASPRTTSSRPLDRRATATTTLSLKASTGSTSGS